MTTRGAVDDDGDVLVIRVWREPGAEPPFRARITYGDPEQHRTITGTATSNPDDVLAAVRTWLTRHERERPSRDAG